MKAEHRKELETNVLAQQITKAYEGLKQGPSRSTLFWVGGAGAVILIVVLFRIFMSSSETTSSKRWTSLDEVVFAEQLDLLMKEPELKDTPQGRLAQFKEARLNLSQGLRDLAANRDLAIKRVETATTLYEKLAQSAGRVPLLHQEALWGAAKGNEALGEYESARNLYKKLSEEYPASTMGKNAKKQLERLDSKAAQAELAELKKALSGTRAGKSE
jgi:hypothetical protein